MIEEKNTKHSSDVGFVPIHVPSNPLEFNGLVISRRFDDLKLLDGNILNSFFASNNSFKQRRKLMKTTRITERARVLL